MWNGSFDTRFTYHFFDIDLTDSLYIEGMLGKHTIDEWFPFGLKEVGVKIYGDQEKKEQKDLFESIKVNGGTKTQYYKADKDIMGKYCIQDCHLTFRLAFNFVTKMDKKLEKFFFDDEVLLYFDGVALESLLFYEEDDEFEDPEEDPLSLLLLFSLLSSLLFSVPPFTSL